MPEPTSPGPGREAKPPRTGADASAATGRGSSGGSSGGAGAGAGAGVPARQPGPRAIDRAQFEEVIRRAAELTLRDADADEQLSEGEVMRIATELGLPVHHVQRALFELPELAVRPRWYDRYYGNPVLSVARVVPSEAPLTLKRVEDYLVTREYLQVVRRRGENIALIPADDTISSLARTFFRSGPRNHIARATRVLVNVHTLPDANAHVRFDVDLSEDRRNSANGAATVGVVGGVIVGAIAAHFAGLAIPGGLGVVPEVVAFGSGLAGTFAAAFSSAANRFRGRMQSAKLELSGLLDRLEHGERLEPPPAPWRRRLSNKLFGSPPER